MSKNYANTGLLMRFIVRRDKVRLPVWILGISIFIVTIAALLPELYTSSTDKMVLAETVKNPAITFMLGYSAGLDNYTDGAMMGHFMLVFSGIFTAIMSVLLVTRHTKEDEEEGRTEMVNSLPVGSLSNLASTFNIQVIVQVIIALLVGGGLCLIGVESMDLEGSMLFGVSVGAIGIFYASLTGLFAQLTSNARATMGFSFGFLIVEYVIRGIGDMGYDFLSFISPLGLTVRAEVYVNNYWWPIFILLLVSFGIFALSLYLNSIRDLGSGFFPTKPGRRHASRFLTSTLGLTLRLQRTTIIAWIVGMIVIGAAYGSLIGDLEGFLDTSELIQQMIPDVEGLSLSERFITMLVTIMSVLGTVPVIMFVLKLSSEEKSIRTEQLLTTSISRNSLLGSYTLIGLVVAPIMQLISVVSLWSAAAFVMDDVISLGVTAKAAMANVPAMWIFVGLAVFLIGLFPRFTSLTWAYLAFSFFVEYLGEMLKLPDWLINVSPFAHIPNLPAEEVEPSVLMAIIGIAFILIVIGLIGYNRRDIEG